MMSISLAQMGFGFMDNIIMIQAGDLIDTTLGVTLGFSTLTAAALGNVRLKRARHTSIYRDTSWRLRQVCSDTSGTLFGGVVETLTARLQLTPANLSPEQLKMRISRQWALGGATVGVICGCLLGMSTLCFMDLEKSDRLKRAAELDTIFTHVVEHGYKLLGAERCTLFLHDAGKAELWTKMSTGSKRGQAGRQRLAAC